MKCLYRDVECDKVDRPRGLGAKPRDFCICCLTGQLIDELRLIREAGD